MDILYIIGKNKSLCSNFELKCSLRSIAKYGKNIDRVFVAGYCPEWLSDEVIKIPYEQPYIDDNITTHEKHCNIAATILYAIDNSDIGEEFLVSMDDHIYNSSTDFNNYPHFAKVCNYSEGEDKCLLPSIYSADIPEYQKALIDTHYMLVNMNLSTVNFTLHRNMHMSREFLNKYRNEIQWMISEGKIVEIFAWYGNAMGITEYVPTKDVLVRNGSEWYKTDSRETHVFAVADFKKKSGLYVLLKGRFPNKCKYEK